MLFLPLRQAPGPTVPTEMTDALLALQTLGVVAAAQLPYLIVEMLLVQLFQYREG